MLSDFDFITTTVYIASKVYKGAHKSHGPCPTQLDKIDVEEVILPGEVRSGYWQYIRNGGSK